MYNYGFSQHPDVPCPEVSVSVFAPINNGDKISIGSILDTGSVITVIPLQIITSLGEGNFAEGQKIVKGAFGKEEEYKTYYINITFAGIDFECIEVLALPAKKYGIIGRDILNDFRISLNAPERKWSVDI